MSKRWRRIYLEEIKHVAPEGPYYLAGASFGGKVALEMAQLLVRRGEAVGLVAMFDTWGPGYPTFRVNGVLRSAGWLYRRVEHHIGSVRLLDAGERLPYFLAKARKTWREIGDVVQLLLAKARGMRKPGEPPEADEGFIALASRNYRPSFYPGKVILFRSKQQPLGIVHDRTLGWGGLAGDLEIHDVVGLHAAVVAEPRVRVPRGAVRPVPPPRAGQVEAARPESLGSRCQKKTTLRQFSRSGCGHDAFQPWTVCARSQCRSSSSITVASRTSTAPPACCCSSY